MGDDLAAFLDFAMRHYEVDATRVYLTGISCGAIGIWDYLGAHGTDVVAASVPIDGHAEWALEEFGCEALAASPVWAFHGAKDEIVPVVHIEGPMERIRACAGADPVEMELTVYPDANHESWFRTYDLSAGHDPYAWLLKHTND
jgi:predicted peptidase